MANKRIMILFGSGVSIPSGLPRVDFLTNRVLNGEWYPVNTVFFPGKHDNELFRENEFVIPIQNFLKDLKTEYNDYFKERTGTDLSYEELYSLCVLMSESNSEDIVNPLMHNSIELIKNKFVNYKFDYDDSTYHIDTFDELLENAKSLIQSVVWYELKRKVKIVGFSLIQSIIEKFDIVDIATLNHDTLVENYMKSKKIDYTDGFGELLGNLRYFNTDLFNKKSVKFYKLHGSINWYNFIDEENNYTTYKYGLSDNPDVNYMRNDLDHLALKTSKIPLFLTGSENKLTSYNFGIFKNIQTMYDIGLFENNTIIVSGYGWNDRGINGRITDWLYDRTGRKIVLLHRNSENLMKTSRYMLNRYDEFIDQGKLIVVDKWFCECNYEDISLLL